MVSSGVILSQRYLIKSEIGAGGMGAVYEATDLRTGAQVAVKVLHPMYARNPQYVSRLRREAQIAASIRTPRAVRVMDLDEHEGMPYLVMEYVEGENLSDKLAREGRLPVDQALSVCIDITRALEGGHAVGVVHRDLKPQNVKITDEGEVKVLDFGIARAEHLPGITGTNMFTGTPEYCAPERIDGQGDIRADIYSVGIMLYELVAGVRPFTAPTAFGVLRQHETAPPPPLPVEVPPAVQAIIDRTLAKRPEERYQTPAELMAALRAARDGGARGERLVPTTVSERPGDTTPHGVAATLVRPGARTPAPAGATDAAESTGGRRLPLGLIGGAAAALVLIGGGAAFALTRGGSSGPGPSSPTAQAAGVVSPTATATVAARTVTQPPSPAPGAARPLLAPGEKIALDAASELRIPTSICPVPAGQSNVKSILRITSIERSGDSRQVSVAYTVSVPSVAGVTCKGLQYLPDAESRFITLQTTKPSGRLSAAPSVGGSGVGTTGADETYGKEFTGVWLFDDVDLEGKDLTLVQQQKLADGSTGGIFHTIKLLPR